MNKCLTYSLIVLFFSVRFSIDLSFLKAIGTRFEIKELKQWTEISLLNRIFVYTGSASESGDLATVFFYF